MLLRWREQYLPFLESSHFLSQSSQTMYECTYFSKDSTVSHIDSTLQIFWLARKNSFGWCLQRSEKYFSGGANNTLRVVELDPLT